MAREPAVQRRPASSARGRVVWRTLLSFWVPVLAVAAVGGFVLQVLGPPPTRVAAVPPPKAPAPSDTPAAQPPAAAVAPRPPGSPIAAPDPALLEPSTVYPDAKLPRIGADGRKPMDVYAAGYDPGDGRPRIALVLAGIGMSEADSDEAMRSMPAAVSIAVSPYALHPLQVMDAARSAGHETLIAIPMEPQDYSLNDAGNEALLTTAAPPANARNLEWALSRIEGYIGATGALGRLHGERFAASEQMGAVYTTLSARGLLYVDPRPGTAGGAARRAVDLVVDEPPVRTEINAKLARLEQMARDHGAALGLVDAPAPVTTERVAAWASTLSQRGFDLVPVSALLRKQ